MIFYLCWDGLGIHNTVIVDYTVFGSLEMIGVIVIICVLSTHVAM